MSLLNDRRLLANLKTNEPLVREFAPNACKELDTDAWSKMSPVQACSIDLHVGEIQLPDSKERSDSRKEYDLLPGHSVIVVTHEILNLPDDIGAVAFPLAGRGQKGVLMLNPGHVDPGFEGKIWFAFINLGREAFRLSQGDRVATVLFWQLCDRPERAWKGRCGDEVYLSAPPEAVASIAGDALMVEQRAKQVAKDVVDQQMTEIRRDVEAEKKKFIWWGALIGAVFPLVVTGVLQVLITQFGTVRDLEKEAVRLGAQSETLQAEMKNHKDFLEVKSLGLDGKLERANLVGEERFKKLEAAAESQRKRIEALENRATSKPSGN